MPAGFQITKNTLSPSLAQLAAGIANKRPILEAMGLQLLSMTVRAFRDAALRALTWPPKLDGTPATLYKRGHLKQSIAITGYTADAVHVGSDTPYAATHQLGSRQWNAGFLAAAKRKMTRRYTVIRKGTPLRPFFPFTPDGQPTPLARERIGAVALAKIEKLK